MSSRYWKIIVVLAVPAFAGAEPLTRDQAVATALERNPSLLSLREEVGVARARVQGASRFVRTNPEIEGAYGPRRAPGEAESSDLSVSITQELEVFGQRGARLDAARSLLAATEARLEARRVEVAAEVRTAFTHLLAAEERVRIAEESRALAAQELEAAEQRLRSGATSRIEVNTARAALSRAEGLRAGSAQQRAAAASALALLVGTDATEQVSPEGPLAREPASVPSTESLVGAALERRRDVAAARFELDAASAERRLAGREAFPNPRLGVSHAEEGVAGAKTVVTQGILAFDLPLFDRNQEARGAAAARQRQAELALAAIIRAVRAEVGLAASRLETASAAARTWAGGQVATLTDSMQLVDEAYRAGKVDFFQLLVVRRETLEARLGYVDALEELNAAEAELLRATGRVE